MDNDQNDLKILTFYLNHIHVRTITFNHLKFILFCIFMNSLYFCCIRVSVFKVNEHTNGDNTVFVLFLRVKLAFINTVTQAFGYFQTSLWNGKQLYLMTHHQQKCI
jgi:hypothetical protein